MARSLRERSPIVPTSFQNHCCLIPAGTKYPLERVKDAIAAHKQPGRQGKVFLESRGVGLSRLSRASTGEL